MAREDGHDRGGRAVLNLRLRLHLEDVRLLRLLHRVHRLHWNRHGHGKPLQLFP